ncbi:arylamine N-acetyltransferase [Aquimarina muelleri]|uniref:Arylamine N-acetyltransferase n=1 Tax=Aquimarina muelleri TaxID=279356 RepID=A0A918JWA1_9FLAO|nr:arylamine N-acetyltransferase [Aquimarina muelleri]MCX2762778.1 arylamine N-acetyltransferase [Aquimarina muelleri]GGX19046.1 hypothetical protein GCM10007384_20480 [Aquimarina muelleri]
MNDPKNVLLDTTLTPEVAGKVLERLAINLPLTSNEEGLTKLYRGWCRNIPFDNFWKRLKLTEEEFSDHDQIDANQFFEIWLQHGLGGTCWTTANAMCELLKYFKFDVRMITGSMGDMGEVNHVSLLVSLNEGKEYIIDTSILNEQPIKIDGVHIENPVHPIQLIRNSETTKIIFEHCTKREHMPCAINKNRISKEQIVEFYIASIHNSLFNDCVYIRKNEEGIIHSIVGTTYYTKSKNALGKKELNEEERKQVLINIMGLSEEIVEHISKTNLFNIPQESILINLTKY